MTEEKSFCEGGCGCGQVRYRVTSAPLIVHACHCRLCQRQTGSSNAVNALFEADRVVLLEGEVVEHMLATPSGHGQRVFRCPSCKVAIWSNYLVNRQDDNIRFLSVGTLDEPELMPPDVHIFTATKLSWYVIPAGQIAVDPFYDFETTWTQASKERMSVLKKRTGTPYR